jgi:signal transduction histidine kinase
MLKRMEFLGLNVFLTPLAARRTLCQSRSLALLLSGMQLLLAGFAIGSLLGLLVTALVARRAYRRMSVLQERARQNERLAELGTLTGGLAHEIKNPLSTIQLNLQLLLEDVRPEDPVYGRLANRIATVQREGSRLKEILDDFLRFAGKIEAKREPVELHSLLDELVDFMTPQAQLQRVQVRLMKEAPPVYAAADPRLLKQAILNLMLNGLQAMGDTGGELILSASRDGSECRIDVTDTGKGMSPEIRQKIFQAYYSLRKGGTGLGLAMARRIIDEHGGRIRVCSEEGKGSVFSVYLPAAMASPAANPVNPA